MRIRLALLPLFALSMQATTISLTGSLNPSDANDVFLYSFTTSTTSDLTFQGWGYGGGVNAAGQTIFSGGFDSYLSVFLGSGPGATFLASNDDGTCPPGNLDGLACYDPSLSLPGMAPGTYTIAITAFDNYSYAEMFGTPFTLGDGFIGLGTYYDSTSDQVRTSNWALDTTSSSGFQVPEPGSFVLLAAGAALISVYRRKQA